MKIRADIIKMYIDVHSWVGVISGLALFIAFYAGAITMFEEPLQRWASRPMALGEATPLERTPELIAKVTAAHPEAADHYTVIMEPGPESPGRITWTTGERGEAGETFHANLSPDGALLVSSEGPSPVAEFIDVLHQQVGLPLDHEIAMPIMGAICLLYAVALVSGVIVLLPSLVKDLFALRIGKNIKRMWLDVHNVLGLFSLPFHIIMALTAIVFAFHDQFYELQIKAFSDPAKAELVERRGARSAAEPPGPLLPPQAIAGQLADQAPDFAPHRLIYSRRDPDGPVSLRVEGADPRHGLRGPTFGVALVDPYSGRIVSNDYLPGSQSGWFQAVTSFFALHFGNFGGNTVRWAYFALGLAGAALFYTGNLLWIESHRRKRRKTAPERENRSVEAMARLTIGVTLGCVIGVSLTVAASKWGLPAEALEAWHSGIYYAAFLAAVGWAFLRGAPRSSIELLWASAAATLLIPLTSLASLAGAGWSHPGGGRLVDVTGLAGAALFAWIAVRAGRRMAAAAHDGVWRVPSRPDVMAGSR